MRVGALVQHDAVVLLDVFDDRARRVAGRLDDADSFFDGDASVGAIVGRVHGGQEGDVDAEGFGGLGLGFADFFAQIFGCPTTVRAVSYMERAHGLAG